MPSIIPDRITELILDGLPESVRQAVMDAEDAARDVRLSRTEWTREAREVALSRLAAANKTLAAYNPKLIVTHGGAR